MDYDYEDELNKIHALLPELLPMIIDSIVYINEALEQGKKILVEGANAPMLDIDFGTYPYVTSSSASIGGIITGLGVSPHKVGTIYGIVASPKDRSRVRSHDGPSASLRLAGSGCGGVHAHAGQLR